MVDPFATRPRPCDGAVLDSNLNCQFFQWDYRADGNGVVPLALVDRGFLLAIDGPQGLAGHPDATSRESEQATRTPGHTRYQMPPLGVKKPYAGFIRGSVELFSHMIRPGQRFRLLGLDGVGDRDANLMEVYPHAGWKALAGRAPLPNKAALAGRRARHDLLKAQGVQFPDSGLPTHDQLDAAMAAWTAYRFAMGQATKEGVAPTLDSERGVLREGYIVQPTLVI
jgi:hypothetical protein